MKKIALILLLIAGIRYLCSAEGNYPFTVKESGSGKRAIVFIPGFACSGEVWNETVAHFKSNHTCYVLTMGGFAGAPAGDAPDIQNWVKQIAAFIQEKKMERPVIVGHSLGGVMAQCLAADFPQLVSQIVVVDALPCLPALSNPSFEASPQADCSLFINKFTSMDKDQFYQMQKVTMANLVADTSKIETIAQWSVLSDRTTMALIFCQLMNTDIRNKITAIKCPTLVLLEPNFKGIHANIEEQYKNLKGAQLHYADKALHFIMYDESAWYLEQLKNFIQ